MGRIAAHHALSKEERTFVLSHMAGLPMTEAYRRAFADDLRRDAEKAAKKLDPDMNLETLEWATFLPTNKALSARAKGLLDSPWIVGFIAEQATEPGEIARSVLVEKAQLEGDRQAALAIIANEDKLGFRDAQEQWAEIMCAIGTDVVVPLPGGEELVVPLKSMFPRYAEALPPNEVILKTIQALDQYMWMQNHPDPQHADIKEDWTFGDGVVGKYPETAE